MTKRLAIKQNQIEGKIMNVQNTDDALDALSAENTRLRVLLSKAVNGPWNDFDLTEAREILKPTVADGIEDIREDLRKLTE